MKTKWGLDVLYVDWEAPTTCLHNSSGILRYGFSNLVLDIDQGIVDYYRSLMPKYIKTNRQMYAAHISVVRKENPPFAQHWNKYSGELVDFKYENVIRHRGVYFWINVFSVRLEEIRSELGLSNEEQFTLPPDGFQKTFHFTLGNIKNV